MGCHTPVCQGTMCLLCYLSCFLSSWEPAAALDLLFLSSSAAGPEGVGLPVWKVAGAQDVLCYLAET